MMEQVIFGFTLYEILFSASCALAITILMDDHWEKRKLIKSEIEKHEQSEKQQKE